MEEYKCEDCGDKLIYCHGEIRRPYFRHYSKSTCSSGGGESNIHKLCKRYIYEYLWSGEIINVTNICGCKTIIKLEIGDFCFQEYKNDDEIYDLAITDNSGILKTIIEVFHTHKQDRIISFYEFRTNDILKDINNLQSCNECQKCYDEKKYLSLLKERILLKEVNHNCDNDTCYDFGIIDKLWKIAFVGKCNSYSYYWKTEIKNKTNDYYSLISLKRCVKCSCKFNNERFKLYCSSCYRIIIKDEDVIEIDMKRFKEECRKLFNKIMIQLPCGKSKFYDKCKICNDLDCENFHTWWISDENKYKHICSKCLYDKLKLSDEYNTVYYKINKHLMDNIN